MPAASNESGRIKERERERRRLEVGGGERLLGASPCKAKELYRDKKLLPHFAYENAATSSSSSSFQVAFHLSVSYHFFLHWRFPIPQKRDL
jgi:hypothetical protein